MTGTSLIPVMVAFIVVVKFRRFIQAFKDSGTTSPRTAKSFEELNLRSMFIFRRLLNKKVLIETNPGKYYLNEENLMVYNKRRLIRILIVGVLILLVLTDILIVNSSLFVD